MDGDVAVGVVEFLPCAYDVMRHRDCIFDAVHTGQVHQRLFRRDLGDTIWVLWSWRIAFEERDFVGPVSCHRTANTIRRAPLEIAAENTETEPVTILSITIAGENTESPS